MRLDCEPAPMILGFVLGPLMEDNLRRADADLERRSDDLHQPADQSWAPDRGRDPASLSSPCRRSAANATRRFRKAEAGEILPAEAQPREKAFDTLYTLLDP